MLSKKDSALPGGSVSLLYGKDPMAALLSYVRKNKPRITDLLHRLSRSTGVTKWTRDAPDGGKYEADMLPREGDSDAAIALKYMLWQLKDSAALLNEVRRRSWGLDYGLEGEQAAPAGGGTSADEIDVNAAIVFAGKAADLIGGLFGINQSESDSKPGQTTQVNPPPPKPVPWLLILGGSVVVFLVLKKKG